MQTLPTNIFDDVKDTAERQYGYSRCKKDAAMQPSFDDSTFYVLGEGQEVSFYTEAQLENMFTRDVSPITAGPGSIVQIADAGGTWRFYSIVVNGKRQSAYELTST